MMARAYLKIWAVPGREGAVRDALICIPGVKMVDLTAGEQDIMAVVEAETYEDVLQIVMGQVRLQDGIQRTITNFAV